jgi:tripartite-type tricarboxylate transporter receptor subunit TctC
VIVPVAAGSGTDLAARLLSERLGAIWKAQVVVDNRPGADGIIAATEFTNKGGDHTLFFSFPGPITLHPILREKLPYDPELDFVPIVAAADVALVIAASRSLEAKTLKDLVFAARSRDGQLNWTSTPGPFQIMFYNFLKTNGLTLARVGYRDIASAVTDLGEGRIHIMLTSYGSVLPGVEAAKVNVLAVLNTQRFPSLPEVPTASEAGFPDLTLDGLNGFFGPRDMSQELRLRIATDVRSVIADPSFASRLLGIGMVARSAGPAEFASILRQQRAMLAAYADAIGLKPRP